MASPSAAAPLAGPITGWASGVPGYVSMYEYVPAKLSPGAPILVVSHYCGGNAAGVFGEAQGGGLVAAADKYGFLMIFPQTSNNCWDVGSAKSLTHDGGGDTQAIAQMVRYAVAKHGANAERVYAVGTSSGAMITEALLAVYPEVFKAGAEFAGVPAGCWAVSYSAANQWSGPCASGQVSHTAAEWGDLVRAMYAGYSGFRPRVQLWHGMADSTIRFANQTEAIKEWTNVLGLDENPSATSTTTLNNHQWTRQSWQDACGATVLEAWSEQNGPHGTDANLNAAQVIPFLGLDQAGSVDPYVARCTTGGNGGVTGGSGGVTGGSGGVTGGSGGVTGAGGGPRIGSGGSTISVGGVDGLGGAGASGAGGETGSGGSPSGSVTGSGGDTVAGVSGGNLSNDSGCSCRTAGAVRGGSMSVAPALLGLLGLFARRRRALRSRSGATLK